MRTGLIIFARFDSARLPGKALRLVAGVPLLARVVARARAVPGRARIVVATSARAVDDPVARCAGGEGADVFRGAADDVAARALAAAEAFGLDAFARISGDSPFFDPLLLADMIAARAKSGLDLATNVMPRTYPPGASCEVVAVAALRRLLAGGLDSAEREHVTAGFYRDAGRYRIRNWRARGDDCRGVRLAVDTAEDLRRADWIAARLGDGAAAAPFDRVVELARAFAATEAAGVP